MATMDMFGYVIRFIPAYSLPARSQASSDQRLPHLHHIHFDLHECTPSLDKHHGVHIATSIMRQPVHWQPFYLSPVQYTYRRLL